MSDLPSIGPVRLPGVAEPAPPEADAPKPGQKPGRKPGKEAGRKRRRRRPRRSKKPAAPPAAVGAPDVAAARLRPRHWVALASFALLVLAPLAATVFYLWTRAADQYHSEVAFSIRSEEVGSAAAGLLGALTQIGTGTASDADILYEYIRSPQIVERVDAALDLRAVWNRPLPGDPVFALGSAASLEALHAHWGRMVEVSFDSAAGIIHVRTLAFAPDPAQAIAGAILKESDALVNRLSDEARDDAIRFARQELDEAEENLRVVRQNLADFRRRTNIVDPTADAAGQTGLLSALNQELAQALVDRDVLRSYAAEDDQRVLQAARRIEAITARIEEERSSLDLTGVTGSLPEVVGRYEELLVDLEFANTAYTQALAGVSAAQAEARRRARYLAPHIQPTLATSALYPRRLAISGLTGLFLLLGWGMAMLLYYNVRDNR